MFKEKRYLATLVLIALAIPLMAATPIDPPHGDYTIELVEEMRVGPPEGAEHFIWTPQATSVEVNAQGHIFISDTKAKQVIELDENGRFLRQIAGPGNGPGEFRALSSFQILKDGTAVAFENMGGGGSSFSFFDKDMKYKDRKEQKSFQRILQRVQFSPDAQTLAANYIAINMEKRVMANHLGLLNRELEVQYALPSFEVPMPNPQKFGDADYWSDYISKSVKASAEGLNGFMVFDQDGNIYMAVANTYEITKWNPELEKVLTITHKYKPIPNTEEEIEATIEPIRDMVDSMPDPNIKSILTENVIRKGILAAEFPPAKWPVQGIEVLEDGLILVLHDRNLISKTDLRHIFDKKGQFLGTFSHPVVFSILGRSNLFKGGKFYNMEENEDGECELIRYGYRLVSRKKTGG